MIPHILLEELGGEFELRHVDRTASEHKSAAYLQLNPNGLIPVLVNGNLVLYETAAICLHLVDTHPTAGLAPPPGTPERAHFYKWLMWLTNTVQATLLLYFYAERWVDAGNGVAAGQVRLHAEAKVGGMLHQIDAHLAAHAKDWFPMRTSPRTLRTGFSANGTARSIPTRWCCAAGPAALPGRRAACRTSGPTSRACWHALRCSACWPASSCRHRLCEGVAPFVAAGAAGGQAGLAVKIRSCPNLSMTLIAALVRALQNSSIAPNTSTRATFANRYRRLAPRMLAW